MMTMFVFALFVCGVFGEFVSVMEGDSVTLSVSLSETQRKEGISWKFGPHEITIAEIEVGDNNMRLYDNRVDGRFKGRLKLDHSGSLTITNIRTTDSGLYQLINTNTNNQLNIFNLGVSGSKFVSVMEGDSVTLSVSLTETQRKEGISWKFGPQKITIAEIEVGDNNMRLYEDRADGRFKGRLKLDHSGSLTITNIRTTDSGLYKVSQTSTDNQLNVFNLTVYGVFGIEFVSVTEGDPVTLSVSLTETQREDRITWKFAPQEINAAEIIIAETEDKGNTVTLHEDRADGRFRDRLKLNTHTGSLTITNTNITHTGLYQVNTIRTNTQLKTINLTVYGVSGSQFVSVMEGDSVTLSVSLTETQRKEGITWKFGPNKTSIAKMKDYKTTVYYDDRLDGRFKNRLHLNNQTGSLTIINTNITHTGLYHLTTMSQDEPLNIFNITVYDSTRNEPAAGDPLLSV
nr:uncharacterized protein LOC129453852 isoform X1 [Misgurnus anguillicaudatus]